MINNLIIGDISIDCANPLRTRDFYAALTGWEKCEAWKTKKNCSSIHFKKFMK